MKIKILLLLILILTGNNLLAETYYISNNGDDTNDGLSENSPWKTIDQLNLALANDGNGGFVAPGDKVLFKRGDTFYGHLLVNRSGTLDNVIELSCYGNETDELPIISGSGGTIAGGDYFQAITMTNSSNILVTNLWVKNDRKDGSRYGYGEYTSFGIKLIANKWGGIISNVTFRGVKVSAVFGITIPPPSDFNALNATGIRLEANENEDDLEISLKDITIENCYFTHIGKAGVWAVHKGSEDDADDTVNRNQNIVVRNNTFYRTGGSGVILSKTYNALVENNDFDQSGYSDGIEDRLAGRGSGMWVFKCKNVIAQYNRSYGAQGPNDSYGMHIDFGNSDIIYQYNYSENSEGGFCEILGDNNSCTYRFNVSVNDGSRDFHGNTLWVSDFAGTGNRITSNENYIYNNTIYLDQNYTPDITIISKNTYVYNNIFMVDNGQIGEQVDINIDSGSELYVSNNLFQGTVNTQFSDLDKNKTVGEPSLQKGGGNAIDDYQIQTGSAAIAAGKSFSQPPFTMAGSGIFQNITEYPTVDAFGIPIDIQNNDPNIGASNANNGDIDSSEDSDNDGVANQIDQCPNTPSNFSVNAMGCTELSSNNFTIEATGETCPDRNNGRISIKATTVHNYIVNINGIGYEFSTELEVIGIPPGVHEFCIQIKEDDGFNQCFKIVINEGQKIEAKLNYDPKKTAINITKGTPPFTIFKNGKALLKTFANRIEINANYNDVINVKSAVLCEGDFSEKVLGYFKITTNPVKEDIHLKFTGGFQNAKVSIYNVQSKLLFTTSIQVEDGASELSLPKNIKNGIYFINVLNGAFTQTEKFILYR